MSFTLREMAKLQRKGKPLRGKGDHRITAVNNGKGQSMGRLSVSAAWEETKVILARDGRLMAAVALALVVFPQTLLGVVGSPEAPEMMGTVGLMFLAVTLIGIAAQVALNRLAIGPSTTVGGAIRHGFVRLIPVFAAFFLFGAAVLVLLMLLAVPLVMLGAISLPSAGQAPPPLLLVLMLAVLVGGFAIFQLVIPTAAAESGGPLRLFARSWQLSRGAYLRLLAFALLFFTGLILLSLVLRSVVGSVVILALGKPVAGSLSSLVLGLAAGLVQAAFTVVTATVLARMYLQLAGRGEAQASVPNSGI